MLFLQQDDYLVPEGLTDNPSSGQLIRICDSTELRRHPFNPNFTFNPQLQLQLSGRQLLIEELPFSIEEIHLHVLQGCVAYNYGIMMDGKNFCCGRCGNNEQRQFGSFPCERCLQDCVYCRKCLMMGRISQCTPLLTWTGPEIQFTFSHSLEWTGKLSPSQKEASDKIKKAIEEQDELLVWAVCGAGKTEMLFAGIEAGLEQGKRLALATPRTDVVLELAPRFKQAFPSVEIATLYGGSEDRQKYAPLTLTTTHQLLRFKESFDVMIIDEVDAFPYTTEEILQRSSHTARKSESSLIYLTATPKEKWQKECNNGKRNCVILPARYHGYPLPIPKFSWCGNWRKAIAKKKIPSTVERWVQKRLSDGKQALVFFPHIELMEQTLPFFQKLDARIQAVHSEDPDRMEKVQQMREKLTPLLLTTTILERGVTFPNIDVAVVGTEDDTFTESALVQISGRVGRNPQFPSGDITFFHYGITRAMNRARSQILRMNRDARKMGLLKNELDR